jgi:hypothetical protein
MARGWTGQEGRFPRDDERIKLLTKHICGETP